MLDGIRKAQQTWLGKGLMMLVLAFIVVSFVIFGIGDMFRGFNADRIAKVGTIDVTSNDYRQAYGIMLQQAQRQLRRPISNDLAHQLGINQQVLSRLVADAVLDNQVRGMGLALSDAQIAQVILADPTFAGPKGFDRSRFDGILRDNGYNEVSFVREQRAVYLRQQLIEGLTAGVVPPQAALDAIHRYQAEVRSIDAIDVPASAAGDVPAPDAATLKSFFDERAAAFRAPERRKLVVLEVSPASLAKPQDVSDADARAAYDKAGPSRYGTPEKRTLEQIVFPTLADATAAKTRLEGDDTFAGLAAERKVDAGIGTLTRDQIVDPATAEAAFSLPEGGTSAPIQTAFGAAIVHVAAIEPATLQPFESVAPAIKAEIAAVRAHADVTRLHDAIEDARSSGKSLTEAAAAVGLSARSVDVDSQGTDAAGATVDLPNRDVLLKAVFASDIGVDNETLTTRDGFVWYEVVAIAPAHAQTLDEVRPAVEAAWRTDEVARRLSDKTAEMTKAISAGTTIEDVAAEAKLNVRHIGDVKRTGAPGLSEGAVAQVFNAPVGTAGSAASADGRTVFKVLDSQTPPLDPEATTIKTFAGQYKTWLADDILAGYIARERGRLGVSFNPEALRIAQGSASDPN